MKKIVLVYNQKKAMVSTVNEAVQFISSLTRMGVSQNVAEKYRLSCTEKKRGILETLFSENPPQEFIQRGFYTFYVTNSGPTHIVAYPAKADTLEEHDLIIQKEKEEQERIAEEKRFEKEQKKLAEMYAQATGWYIVTIEALVSKIKGNDGVKCYSFKVLANSKMDAYTKAVNLIEKDGLKDPNVSFIYEVYGYNRAYIEYVGIWTDEAQLEYRS